ncbi:MAG: dihydrolipoamide acetyltransferase component of pyruvate dehydrogenase complex [Hyphococcus sp.]|nr:MAG: dihydrolipoamide acetyltransferase component of pyruvate dehydrogenase complex [Marinicaulis sp.]
MTDLIDILAPVEQEGTKAVVKSWYKNVGETIQAGDPLVELETDKVAVEVPAPVSGVVQEIMIDADGEAEPGAVLGRLTQGGSASEAKLNRKTETTSSQPPKPSSAARSAPKALDESLVREHRLSPSVRRLVNEHGLEPSDINGTGKDGRLTRGDVQAFLDSRIGGAAPVQTKAPLGQSIETAFGPAQKIPHDTMRRRIAEHMSHSVQTAPHVTAVFEADFSAVIAHRNAHKAEYLRKGAKLTFTAYIIAACVEAMKVSPTVNSRWNDDYLEVFDDINIGVGVALGDKGLIVPVVHQAQARSHFGIAKELHSLTERARDNKLAPKDVRGGTFSISNHGTSGSLVASPIIINQPQSAILGVGKLEKRVVVRTIDGADAMQIRPMAFVSLTIDHRVLDGAQTNAWLTKFVEVLETWPQE